MKKRKTIDITPEANKALALQAIEIDQSPKSYIEQQVELIAANGPYSTLIETNQQLEKRLKEILK